MDYNITRLSIHIYDSIAIALFPGNPYQTGNH